MKGIYFLSTVFILILIAIGFIIPKKNVCLSQQYLYFGTPGFVREGFDIDGNRWKNYERSIIRSSPNYPYCQATHIPTNFAVEMQKKTWKFNEEVSELMATTPPKGNMYTVNYPCRKSSISYNNNIYDNCSAFPSNTCSPTKIILTR